MPHALIGLGSNLGDRRQMLDRAVQMLAESGGVESVQPSTWRVTRPIGGPADQAEFVNGAALVVTVLSPLQLLTRLHAIEAALGRVRHERWARGQSISICCCMTMSCRVLLPLELPHPRMAFRRFVLEPAAEIAGSILHPTIGWTVSQLFDHLRTAIPYVAISGTDFRATHPLAAAVAEKIGCRLLEFPAAGDPTPPAGSSGLTPQRAIEFLRDEAELIARDRWPAGGEGAIGSFWVEDLLAIGDVLWPGSLDAAWQRLSATVVPPKLLVLYETTVDCDFGLSEKADEQQQALTQQFCQRLNVARRVRAERRGIGPVLRLSAENPLAAEAELVAAIQAMS